MVEQAKMKKRISFLDTVADAWTMDETVEEIDRRLKRGIFTQHVVVNAAKVVNMKSDRNLREAVLACNIINIDGMGVVWGARALGHRVPERVAGIDLFHRLLDLAKRKKYSVFFLGAKDDVVKEAVARATNMYPGLEIAGYNHGYFWDDEEKVVEKIRASGANMLFVAMTSPKKEEFINRWKDKLGVTLAMGVGGTFDILAGKTKRAPVWMQNAGIEWFYRVIQEPGRMWKRYLVTNTVFIWLVFRDLLRGGIKPRSCK